MKVSGVVFQQKSQITKHKYQMVRQAHHLTTLSQVEGQITMTKIQNPKQLVIHFAIFNLQFSALADSG